MFKLGDIPVPGYTLVRMIGRGQYGEVWEARGPGGTRLAIKIISLRENKGQIELKSIHAVKEVRHANLIPIHAIWLLDQEGQVLSDDKVAAALAVTRHVQRDHTLIPDELRLAQSLSYLIICMAMADGNLEDRLRSAVANGDVGIPPAELVRYMGQAADGLDFLNSTRHAIDGAMVGIQHRDVKPANLLLLGDTVVVGDFGVATTLSEFDAMATAVLGSLAFMAPESLAQRPSQTSDQYALAITYYQLRFNELPYDAQVPLDQLIAIHKEGRLDFRRATPLERNVLKRATALEPRRRYASCREFAAALAEAWQPTATRERGAWPGLVATAVATLACAAAFWYFDPAGWFRRPAAPPVINSVQMYTISIPTPDVRGEWQILPAKGETAAAPQTLGPVNTVRMAADDKLRLRAESASPFFAPLEQEFSVAELEQRRWIVTLPPIAPLEIEQRLRGLLEADDLPQASELWKRARAYDSNFNSIAQPKSEGIGQAVSFHVSATDGRLALVQRDPNGDHVAVVDSASETWSPTLLPSCEAERSPIESLLFREGGGELIVARQRSIWRWTTSAMELEPIWNDADTAATWRFLQLRSSSDGHWLAAGDSAGGIRVWSTAAAGPVRLCGEAKLESSLVDLQFDRDNQRIVVVTESVPLLQIELAKLSAEAAAPVSLSPTPLTTQPAFAGPALARTARWGRGSLALASEDQLVFAANLLSGGTPTFSSPVAVPGGSLFLLVGAEQAARVMSASDGDPPSLVWDPARGEIQQTVTASQLTSSVRDAALSPDGRWAAVSTHNGQLMLLDLVPPKDEKAATRLLEPSFLGYYAFVGFSADSRYLWALSQPRTPTDNCAVLRWDLRRLQLVWSAE